MQVAAMRCAKERSGIRAVEETVKSVVGPVYDKFHLVPEELLRFADRSLAAAHGPPVPPRTTASDVAGVVYAKCEPAATVLYGRFEAQAAAWRRLLPRVPKAAHWTEKYNERVVAAAERIAKMLSEKRA